MKQTMQRKGVLTVAILMMFVLVFAGMFIASMTGSNRTAGAADYSYNENVNTVTWDDDTGLTVVFTCTDNDLGMFDWALFLFRSSSFANVSYDGYTHKLTNSSNMGQENATYYFDSNVSTREGTITVTYGKDTVAQNSDETLAEIWAEDDWRVVIGPHHDYGGNAYNCDYYVGSRQTIMSSTPALPPVYIGKQWMNGDAFVFNDNAEYVYILSPGEDIQCTNSWQDRFVTFVSRGNGYSLYTIDDYNYFKILDEGHTEAPVGIELVSGDGTEENPYVFKGVWTLEFTISVVQEQNDIVENGNVGRPYASVNDMNSVTVRYDITKNPGIHNLLAVLDYDHTAFTLGQVAYPDPVTALGEPTPNDDVPDSFVWDITGDAYDELKEGFLTVTFLINNVVSGTEYTFGLKIKPYVMNASTVAYHINTINNQLGEQSNVPVTQIVKTFTPVVRQEAVIEIGGSEYVGTASTINPNGRRYRRTYANRQFTTLKVDADVSTSDYFDYEAGLWTSAEDAFVVHYTYNGDAQPVIDWMSYADAEAYIADNTYQYTSISAPTNPGQYAVIISAPATLNYYAAAPVLCEVKIERLTMSISIANAGHTYLDDPQTIAVSGVVEGVGVTVTPYLIINDTHVQPSSSTPAAVYNIYYDVEITDNSVFTIYSISVNGTAVLAEVSEGNPNRTYTVTPKEVTITINAASHTYGDSAMGQLTYELSSEVPNAEINLTTTATLDSVAGEYNITISSYNVGSNYTLTNPDEVGTYTVNKKAVSATIADKSSAYNEALVPLTYTLSPEIEITLSLSTNANNMVPGSYDIIIDTEAFENTYGNRYALTITNDNDKGVYTITSAPEAVAHFTPFFSGATLPYNAQSQNLLIVGDITENWWNYTPETFNRTDVGDYQITITITVKESFQTSYTLKDGNNETVDQLTFSVTGHITAIPITIRAIGGSHVYGNSPSKNYATPTLDQEYEITEGTYYNDNLNISMSINTANDLLTSTTDAGTYTVTLTASNANYVISYYNNDDTATYTVNKATPSIDLVANNVYYNRDLDVTATVTPNVGTATLTYYTDDECENALSGEPVNAGTYYVKASVVGNSNYNSYTTPEAANFEIKKVKLADIGGLTYSHGNVTWYAILDDAGKTASEEGVSVQALKTGTTVIYKVYNGDTLVKTIEANADRTFDAAAVTNSYKIVAESTNNENYLSSTTDLKAAYSVTFVENDENADPAVPPVQYIFSGETLDSFTNPVLSGKTFVFWAPNSNADPTDDAAAFDITQPITASATLYAIWSNNAVTITLKYLTSSNTTEGETKDVFTFTRPYQSTFTYTADVLPVKAGIGPHGQGITYTFANKWVNAANENEVYTVSNRQFQNFTVPDGDVTFIAVFDESINLFNVTYYFYNEDAGEYEQFGDAQEVAYGSTIAYRGFNETIRWFKADYWYGNEERTIAPQTVMSDEDINVYGAYKFDIGYGDVDGNGDVNTDDITLYRKWIVGGYPMTVVEVGNEWATVTDENFEYVAGAFFLKRVADINADNSKDVRDVTITRMAFVGGYDWDIESGIRVTGESIERTKTSYDITALQNALSYGRARIYNNINASTVDVSVVADGDIYLDLKGNKAAEEGGYTLTVKSLTLITNGYGATVTITNGTIVSLGTINIIAPNGNVVINNVDAYVNGDQKINLQAASSSLHFVNKVNFYDYSGNDNFAIDDGGEIVANDNNKGETIINVAEGTHVVVEVDAEIVVKEIVVASITIDTNNNNATVTVDTTDDTRAITLTNNTEADIEELVTGEVTEVVDNTFITTFEELAAATGDVVLGANINCGDSDITYSDDVTLNLNGHNITFNSWGFEVRNGATFTINGNGNVTAVEAPLYAQYAGKLIVNGGTYTSTDNFVIGTHGSAGRGGNFVTVNGGTFNGSYTTAGYVACGIYVANDDTVVVNGGTFNITNGVGILSRSGSTTVAGGTFYVTGNGVTGKIGDSRVVLPSGAVLVVDLAANYPGGDPVLTNNTAYDVYTVVGNAEELTAATGNVVLGENINCTSDIVYASDVTLNLNGHNITFSSWGFEVRNGATFTINGNGNVTAAEAALYAQYAGKLIVNGGTYTSTNNFVIGTNGSANRGGNIVTVNGGVFNGSINTEGYVACGIYVANNDTVVVNGGTFNITNGVGVLSRSGSTTVNAGTFNVTGNGVVGQIGDSRVVLPSGAVLVVDLAANYPGGDPTLVNETDYPVYTVVGTVAELTSAFANGGNVVLGEDISEIPYIAINADTTLNLNGHALSFNNWGLCVDSELSTPITLTVNGNGTVSAKYCLDVEHGNNLIVNGGTYTAVECCVVSYSGGHVEINGGTFTSIDNSVISTNGTAGLGENEITINGGTFNGGITSAGYIACGIYVANSDTVVVNGGTFNITNGVGILARSGSTTVMNGVVFNMLGENTISGKVGDKSYSIASGKAIVEDKTDPTYPGGQPTVDNQTSYQTVVLE